MLEDITPEPENSRPLPFDTITLHPHNAATRCHAGPFVVADIPPDTDDTYELNLPDHHPGYWDWAATVVIGDIASITRCTPAGPRTWTPAR
ncbi:MULTISPECIES: DUF6211 family protein [Streptomycetaceae]|uniref:DUF6211 family protein n=1 Tax=Streptomycetaceae TaxID=2062 RepID=UPI00300B55E8